jgi:hypothetical protein
MVVAPVVAHANDWEKFFHAASPSAVPIIPSDQPPQVIDVPGDAQELVNSMWRKGFALLGVSSFNSPNASTKDALRFAEKLHAAYVGMATRLASSRTIDIPMTTPTTSTSYTSGNVSAAGTGGFATGTYSGTTVTSGSETTYIPFTVNRFDKVAVYFGPLAKQGSGLLFRFPTPDEVSHFETRHLLIVRAVRDGSPADVANVLEGDVVATVNGDPATIDIFHAAIATGKPMTLHVIRNGQPRDLTLALSQ